MREIVAERSRRQAGLTVEAGRTAHRDAVQAPVAGGIDLISRVASWSMAAASRGSSPISPAGGPDALGRSTHSEVREGADSASAAA